MITPNEITAAVAGAVETLFPGEPVYVDLTPRNFDRPSDLVELTGIAVGAVSPGGVELVAVYGVSYDEVAVMDWASAKEGELTIPFTATGVEYLDKIEP